MSAETVTLEIHRDAPPEPKERYDTILAKFKGAEASGEFSRSAIIDSWEGVEWWAEIPAPVKPKRFVVNGYNQSIGPFVVANTYGASVALAIPTREAAQRIADIYEETTP